MIGGVPESYISISSDEGVLRDSAFSGCRTVMQCHDRKAAVLSQSSITILDVLMTFHSRSGPRPICGVCHSRPHYETMQDLLVLLYL